MPSTTTLRWTVTNAVEAWIEKTCYVYYGTGTTIIDIELDVDGNATGLIVEDPYCTYRIIAVNECGEVSTSCSRTGPPCFGGCLVAPTATISGSEAATSPVTPVVDGTYSIVNEDPYTCTDEITIYNSGGMLIRLFTTQQTLLVGPDIVYRLYALLLYEWSVGIQECGYFFEYEIQLAESLGCPAGNVGITFLSRGWASYGGFPDNGPCESGADIDTIAIPVMTFEY